MESYEKIFEKNRQWVETKKAKDADFLEKLSRDQTPGYLYIGCSDSRIPANEIMGMEAGEVFVHRNVGNLVNNIDLNVMSVLNYGIVHLKVKHVIVCGHYGCGGIKAAMSARDLGILNPWLRIIRDVYRLHQEELDAIDDESERMNRLVELNVQEQCINVIKTAAVQKAYAKTRFPVVHGWVFDFRTGLLKDLEIDFGKILRKIQKIYDLTQDPDLDKSS